MTKSLTHPPHWVRLGLVGLLAYFYVDGFLKGASGLEIALFTTLALPFLAGLLHTLSDLESPTAPALAQVVASTLGAMAVAFLARELHLEPVLAAAVVGVVASSPITPTWLRAHAAPVYVGAFAGMTSPLVLAHPLLVAAAGAIAGLLFSVLRSTWLGVGGKLGMLAFTGVTLASLLAHWLGVSAGEAKLLELQLPDKLAILVAAPAAAVATYELQQRLGWSPVLASASVTCTFVLAMVFIGAESLYAVAPAAIACFGGSFVAMTGEVHAADRPWLPAVGGVIYGLLQISFEPTLAGIGGDFGATAVVAVLVVIGLEKLAAPVSAVVTRD